MKKILYILLASLVANHVSLFTIYSQPSITWNRLYDGGFYDDDYGYGLCKTTDGNFVLGGYTPFHGAMVLKIDGYGNTIWKKHYLGSSGEAITATNDGGVVLASPTLLKINSQGDTVWLRSYPGNGISNLYDVIQCSDGGYFTCGRAYFDSGYVMKTDSQGNFLWKQMISDTSLIVRMYAGSEAYSNGFIATGIKFNLNQYEMLITRLDANGGRIWTKTYGSVDSLGRVVKIFKIPPYYLLTCIKGFMKIDEQGNFVSAKLIPTDTIEGIKDVCMTAPSKFAAVTNLTYLDGTVLSKLLSVDTNGSIIESQIVNFSDFVRLKKVTLAGNGDIIFGGDAARYDTSQTDFYALRCDSNLYFPPIKVVKLTESIPSQFRLHQNFPNPFNPVTKIIYELPIYSSVKLTVFDILGREIAVLVNENQKAGIYEVQWDAGNYPSGVYFYRLITNKFTNTKKMILLK